MSCYEWERGTITIPAKDWARFRKALLEAWNAKQLGLLERARKLHARLRNTVKGKRGATRSKALRRAFEDHVGHRDDDLSDLMFNLLISYSREDGHGTWSLKGLPKKKDLKTFPVSKGATIMLEDATVIFDNDRRTVTWDVPENNHAREHARNHWFAKELFQRLRRIKWTRGSGGRILGNDEYSQDAGREHEGGGGSYVTAEYGPKVGKGNHLK